MDLSWSRVFAVFLKELVQMRRDRPTFAIMIMMPVMQLVLFGFAINTDPRHMPAVVEMRSSASVAIETAVSNPKVMSVPAMSLSIVFGTPTTGTPCS